jgi:hypothetical protein
MGVRTAQRYEECGLPVRRPAGKERGSVITTKRALDAWVAASPIRSIAEPQGPAQRRSPAWTDLKASVAEMKRLRIEMERLRAEAVESLESLRSRLHFVVDASQKLLYDPRPWRLDQIHPLQAEIASSSLIDTYQAKAG